MTDTTTATTANVAIITPPRFEVPSPLVEVKVAPAPFDFTPLEVNNLGAEESLGRVERLGGVGVHHQPAGVNAAEEKPFFALLVAVDEPVSHVRRHPAIRRQVNLAPVMQVFVRPGDQARFPARRDAIETAQRHECQRLDATVAMMAAKRVMRQ